MPLSQVNSLTLKEQTTYIHGTDIHQVSEELHLRGQYGGVVILRWAGIENIAIVDPYVTVQVQSADRDGNKWGLIGNAERTITGTPATFAVDAAGADAGDTEVPVKTDPTGSLTQGDTVAFVDASGNVYWHTVTKTTASKIYIDDGLQAALVEDDACWSGAVVLEIPIQLGIYPMLRVVVMHNGATGPNFVWESELRGWYLA